VTYVRCRDVSDTSRTGGHGACSRNQYSPHTLHLHRPSRLDQPLTRQQTPFLRAAVVLATLLAAFVASSTAVAAPPCSKAILDDWLDNSRIDRIYDLPCYEAAIAAIPSDLLDYTDAADVIARAFQNVSGKRLERQLEGPSTIESPPPGVVPPVDSTASAFPVPLLVLGGMSVVLLAAGGLGYVQRRRRQD